MFVFFCYDYIFFVDSYNYRFISVHFKYRNTDRFSPDKNSSIDAKHIRDKNVVIRTVILFRYITGLIDLEIYRGFLSITTVACFINIGRLSLNTSQKFFSLA